MIEQITEHQWREDIRYLADTLAKNHANAFHSISEERFRAEVGHLAEEVGHFTGVQIVAQIARLVNLIGDEHTHLTLPDSFKSYPFEFIKFGDDFRLVSSTHTYQQVLGKRLAAIDSHPINEVLTLLDPWVSHGESSTRILFSQAQLLSQATLLHAIGITEYAENTHFTFLDDAETEHTLPVEAAELNRDRVFVYGQQAPLYRQRFDEAIWFTILSPDNAAYINFVRYPDGLDMLRFAYSAVEQLEQHKPRKLIIDFRRNGGGNFEIGDYGLIRLLSISRALPERVYGLIGRDTFSAGMVNAIHCRDRLKAHLVGEPTGAKPNHYQELSFFTLPNSGLSIGHSIRYYQFQQEDSDGVQPDTALAQDWNAFRAGRDTLVEWCLSQP